MVGGGIGGLACAIAIAQRGRQVHVLEAAHEFGEIGAGIQLAPNGTRALAALGVFDRVRAGAVEPRELVYMDAHSGERITALACGEPMVARYGFPYLVVHRRDLHQALLEAAEASENISLETEREVTAAEDRGDRAAVECADGSEYVAEALVGADGLHSVVRRTIADDKPVAWNFVAYRGTIPFSRVTPHAGADSMVLWVGENLHLVQYKLRGGHLYNQVGVFASDRFGGEEDWGTPEELDARFATCCELVAQSAALLNRDMRWPMYDREPIETWTRSRITLAGDAAHPMLQYIAQGGCQALEDAVALGRHLGPHEGVYEAFLAYERERIPHTTRVQILARRSGEIHHLGGVAAEVRNAQFSKRAIDDYEPFDWLYGAHDAVEPPALGIGGRRGA